MPSYNQKQFHADLDELSRLINDYSQEGGAQMKRSSKKSASLYSAKKSAKKSLSGGGKGVDKEGQPIRSFRLVELQGKDVTDHADYRLAHYHGTISNNTPESAAKHAFSRICNYYESVSKADCHKEFKLRETTRGSKHKVFGPYVGVYLKSKHPYTREFVDPKTGKKRKVVHEYKPHIKLVETK